MDWESGWGGSVPDFRMPGFDPAGTITTSNSNPSPAAVLRWISSCKARPTRAGPSMWHGPFWAGRTPVSGSGDLATESCRRMPRTSRQWAPTLTRTAVQASGRGQLTGRSWRKTSMRPVATIWSSRTPIQRMTLPLPGCQPWHSGGADRAGHRHRQHRLRQHCRALCPAHSRLSPVASGRLRRHHFRASHLACGAIADQVVRQQASAGDPPRLTTGQTAS